jgi:hypothetical protein
VMPNYDKEQDRLDLKHHVFKLVLGGSLFRAPIGPNPQHILDVGTGTVIWAIECADEFPSAEVVGIDLSPIQPGWVPPNCSFVVDNAEDEWPYGPKNGFDLVHWRVMSVSVKDWPRLYEQAFKHLKLGGWLEAQEHDVRVSSDEDSVDRAKDVVNWFSTVDLASEKFAKKMDVADRQKQWTIDAGFVDVRDDIYKVCILMFSISANLVLMIDLGASRPLAQRQKAQGNRPLLPGPKHRRHRTRQHGTLHSCAGIQPRRDTGSDDRSSKGYE